MGQTLANVAFAFQQHTLIAFVVALALFLAAIAAFSGGDIGSVVDGMFRLLASIFTAPFHFLRTVVGAMSRFRADDIKEASSHTFLLWRSVQYALFLAFIVSMAIISAGVTISLLGLWPSEQLSQHTTLTAQLEAETTALKADSVALALLVASNPAQAAQQRTARLAALAARFQELDNLETALADSLDKTNGATTWAFFSELWSTRGNNIALTKTLLVAQTDSFAERHTELPRL